MIYTHDTRTWEWWAVYSNIGTDFRADLGFMPWVNRIIYEAGLGYTWNATETSWYSQLNLKSKIAHVVDQTGFLLFHEDVVQFTIEGPLQSHSVIRPSRVREGYNGQIFDFNRLRLHVCGKPNGHSHVWLNLDGRRPGRLRQHPARRLLQLRRRLLVPRRPPLLYRTQVHPRTDGGGRGLALHHRHRSTPDLVAVQPAGASSGRSSSTWTIEFNPELYSDDRDPEYQGLFTQFLFSYKLNPRTVLFVGYSDNSAATQDYGFTKTDRTIFAKVGYAWVL